MTDAELGAEPQARLEIRDRVVEASRNLLRAAKPSRTAMFPVAAGA